MPKRILTGKVTSSKADKTITVVVERKIMPEEMAEAEECFLTGTAAEVTPVQSIGDYKFKPGDLCLKLTKAYSDLVNNH